MVEAGSAREWVWCCGHRVSSGICDGPGIYRLWCRWLQRGHLPLPLGAQPAMAVVLICAIASG